MPKRRSMCLSVAFLAAAIGLVSADWVRGQPPEGAPGSHRPLVPFGGSISPDQVRRALEQLGIQPLAPGLAEVPGLEERVRQLLQKEQPGLDPQQRDAMIRQLLNNPQFRKQLSQFAQQQGPKGSMDPGALAKLWKNFPPPSIPPDIPRNDAQAPQPLNPEPRAVPKGNFPRVPPPMLDPDWQMPRRKPPELAQPEGPPPQWPGATRFPGVEPPSVDPNSASQTKALRAVAAMWEKNIGPLKETPAVKRALIELVTHTADLKDSKGNNIWDSLTKDTGDGSPLGDFMSDASRGGWSLPDIDLPRLQWGSSRTDIGRADSSRSSSGESWWSRRGQSSSSSRWGSGSGSGLNLGLPGLEGSWLPVILLAAILLGALLYWRFWYLKDARVSATFDLGGLGGWPVDPRKIATRQDVVVTFEYLSVLICGPSAKMWTHNTIADALAELAATHAETAAMLARLYELARYAPIEEPLTNSEVAEARRLVCRLAGLDHE